MSSSTSAATALHVSPLGGVLDEDCRGPHATGRWELGGRDAAGGFNDLNLCSNKLVRGCESECIHSTYVQFCLSAQEFESFLWKNENHSGNIWSCAKGAPEPEEGLGVHPAEDGGLWRFCYWHKAGDHCYADLHWRWNGQFLSLNFERYFNVVWCCLGCVNSLKPFIAHVTSCCYMFWNIALKWWNLKKMSSRNFQVCVLLETALVHTSHSPSFMHHQVLLNALHS